jgi:hypothetical protein
MLGFFVIAKNVEVLKKKQYLLVIGDVLSLRSSKRSH